eukprot:8977478-Lingulodinium_polyedra.AAC.1
MFFGRCGSISQLTFQGTTQRLSAERRRDRASRSCWTVAPRNNRSQVASMGRKGPHQSNRHRAVGVVRRGSSSLTT